MRKIITRMALLTILVLGLASCSKKVADTVTSDLGGSNADLVSTVQKINTTRADLTKVSGHLSLDLSTGSQSVKVSGELKMKRDDIIQITLSALGGLITVGRLEFTPADMMVMDNMNKRYVKLPYSEVPFLKDNGIDFYTFQALLWNELFLPGTKGAVPQAKSFSSAAQDKGVLLTHQAKNLVLSFLANPASGRLEQSNIKGQADKGMTCDYQGWGKVNDTSFPNKMQVSVALGVQKVLAKMDISKLRTDDSWKGTPTKVDEKKFQELTLQQVWNAVMSLAK